MSKIKIIGRVSHYDPCPWYHGYLWRAGTRGDFSYTCIIPFNLLFRILRRILEFFRFPFSSWDACFEIGDIKRRNSRLVHRNKYLESERQKLHEDIYELMKLIKKFEDKNTCPL